MSEEIRSTQPTMHDAHPVPGERRGSRRLSRVGAVGAAGTLLIGGVLGVVAVSGTAGASASLATATIHTVAAAAVSTAAAQKKPATDEALLALLLTDLPKGKTSHYAKFPYLPKVDPHAPKYDVQTWLDQGNGPGQIRLSLSTPKAIAAYARLLKSGPYGTAKSWKLKNGDTVTALTNTTDCIQARSVAVERKDGSVVKLDLGSCLVWNATLNPRGRYGLTQAQAIKVAEGTRIASKLTVAQLRKGAQEFPHLHEMA